MAWIVAKVMGYIDNYMVEMTLTICLAYGAYLIGEQIHVSGVLAVVAAGILSGRQGLGKTSEEVENSVEMIWEYLAYIANAAIFLIVGLSFDVLDLFLNPGMIILAIVMVLLTRAVLTYGLVYIPIVLKPKNDIPVSWRHVLFWGGQRGGVSIALALSLPFALDSREFIQQMTFGVVLFSAFIQATTMPYLLERLDLDEAERGSEASQSQTEPVS
jgi:CPA1 family monovalent cation:H+ antiporter